MPYINDSNANVNIFFTNPMDSDSTIGIAWLGAACTTANQYRAAIIESYYNTDVQNAQVDLKNHHHHSYYFSRIYILPILCLIFKSYRQQHMKWDTTWECIMTFWEMQQHALQGWTQMAKLALIFCL
jgi:hypothetical protein